MRNAGGLFLVALLAAPGIGHAKRAVAPETWLCGAGEFVSGDGEMVVDIGHDSIGLGDACPMTPATVKSSKKRATFSGRWAGCTGFTGPVRVAAKLATGKCNVLDVKVRAPKQKMRRHFQASRSKGDPKDCQSSDTFDQIQRRIFGARGCRVETCHGSAKSGGLDLRVGAAYASLVGAAATGRPVPSGSLPATRRRASSSASSRMCSSRARATACRASAVRSDRPSSTSSGRGSTLVRPRPAW